MTKLPVVIYTDLRKVAEMAGFHWVSSKGSHNKFRNAEGRTVTIPDHGSQVIVRPFLRRLLRQLGITVKDYLRILEEI